MQPPQGPNNQPYDAYRPQQPAGASWTQRPLPGQDMNAWPAPGQVPPPAQIAPDPTQAPYSGAPQGAAFGVPSEESASQMGNGQTPVQPSPSQGGYLPPKTGLQRVTPKRNRLGSILLILLALALVAIALFYYFAPGKVAYGTVRVGALSDLYTGDAVVVRNETVYAQESVSQIVYNAEEGGSVDRGDLVATIYTAGFNAKEWVTLKNYRDQIKEYSKTLIASSSGDTQLTAKMDQVSTLAMEVQQLVQGIQGNINVQEKQLTQAMQEQQTYIRQKYPDDQKLGRLYDDENGQAQRISTWSKQFAAASDGLISFYTDGYENGLNMITYADFSPVQVRDMYNGRAPEAGEQSRKSVDVYRMVRLEPWVVLMLCSDRDWTPIKGHTYNLTIESFDNVNVTATVESFTRSGGELLVRLLVQNTSVLPSVLYLRTCQVQLSENMVMLTVPSRAIYVQNGRKGVVMHTMGTDYWTGVEVVSDDGVTAYIIPDNAGVLYDGIEVRLF